MGAPGMQKSPEFAQLPTGLRRRSYLQPSTGCWVWKGALRGSDGAPSYNGRSAARVAYLALRGAPLGTVYAACGNPLCISPSHASTREGRPDLAEKWSNPFWRRQQRRLISEGIAARHG